MAQVVVILGSKSDHKIVMESQMDTVFHNAEVSFEVAVISAHRHPRKLQEYCRKTLKEGALVYIGVAGMSAALPGAIASYIHYQRPVIGVGLSSGILEGLDALLSIVRMPSGVPVMTTGLDKPALYNAAIVACQIIALANPEVNTKLQKFLKEENDKKAPQYGVSLTLPL